MRLVEFISTNTEAILDEWSNFARTLPQGGTMDLVALRDHANEMLTVIAVDLRKPQSIGQQKLKAHGRSDAGPRRAPTAAQAHGSARADSGFSVEHMVAEFRALRASVIRLWLAEGREASSDDVQDLIRFNESIDQAIAESITRFNADVGRTKERFLAILSHDLRTPLSAILTSSEFMLDRKELVEPYTTLLSGIASSARRMTQLVADLLDFTRTRFGDTIPINMEQSNVRLLVHAVVAEICAAHPQAILHIETSGLLRGLCDPHRITQALTNLVANAVEHGYAGAPITIAAHGSADHCIISVHSTGPVVPPERIATLFEPIQQNNDRRHLGLGLYIVDKIVTAHGGRTTFQSAAETGTVAAMHLPLAS